MLKNLLSPGSPHTKEKLLVALPALAISCLMKTYFCTNISNPFFYKDPLCTRYVLGIREVPEEVTAK